LAVVEDLFRRMVVGWSMAEGMESRLVVDALAHGHHPPPPGCGVGGPLGPREPVRQRPRPTGTLIGGDRV
jgi:transposase InsO family protein